MFRILESQGPTKQKATDTISILSSRLQSAKLLEDRRAAILGLRSFAKLYPASVASGALRNLINSLSSDSEDVDTTKIVLETLLMLFNPEETSPEASDDIALWLADEFTQRQENITILLHLLDRPEFFSRLYSLQLISAISTARPERTQECVYTAPLGVTRLVAVLDDQRGAVRAEGVLLLITLTPSSPDLQKLVAFENAFDRIFEIIKAEGSLTHGGIVVQDCLSLLANLLGLNTSNQSFFRETGGISKIAEVLDQVIRGRGFRDVNADLAPTQSNKNLWGLLSVIRLFLLKGGVGTRMNQASFWQCGVTLQVLDIAFSESAERAIRAEALATCADLIRGNIALQENFAHCEVVSSLSPWKAKSPNVSDHAPTGPEMKVNVIQGLLDLALSDPKFQTYDVRLRACQCIQAYLYGHAPIRRHFLQRARNGHLATEHEANNILTILLEGGVPARSADPYRHWVAAVLLFHLIYDDYEAKSLARDIAEGDAAKGEEVVTCIQVLSGNLIMSVQGGDDDRIGVGYLMVLSGWLYEDPDAVNDFLDEGSNVQSLIQIALQPSQQTGLLAGLCAFLLGIVYEFSTKDSPIPRTKLHEILTTRLEREQFYDKMHRLREHPLVRDFEVSSHRSVVDQSGFLPNVFFDKTFVDFLKDNYSRIFRAIDRDPGIEVSVVADGEQKGVSRELVDSLKLQVEDRSLSLQRIESEILNLQRRLDQELADHRKTKESSTIEITRIKVINESLQRKHEEELRILQEQNQSALTEAADLHQKSNSRLELEIQQMQTKHQAETDRMREKKVEEVEDLKKALRLSKHELEKSNKDHAQDLRTAHEEYNAKITTLESRLNRAEMRVAEGEQLLRNAREMAEESKKLQSSVQSELDDLLMVLADLEEKRVRYKERLTVLGDQVSDGEADQADEEDN